MDTLIEDIIQNESLQDKLKNLVTESEVPSKTILLQEGEISTHIHFIKKGSLRLWFNKDGKDITFQFFFEGQAVASIDSFMNSQPSLFNLESIERTQLISISAKNFKEFQSYFPEIRDRFSEFLITRLSNYTQLFLSRIKDSPKERYEELIKLHPEIIKRVPQHYIASFLGITPISLSRIRSRK